FLYCMLRRPLCSPLFPYTTLFRSEFAEDLPMETLVQEINKNTVTPRRDFLKMIGFGVGTATLAACNRAPVRKAVPYLVKPEGVTDRKSTRLNSSHVKISYAVFCLK